jgi:hypothetical protein
MVFHSVGRTKVIMPSHNFVTDHCFDHLEKKRQYMLHNFTVVCVINVSATTGSVF